LIHSSSSSIVLLNSSSKSSIASRFLAERDVYWQGIIRVWLKEANKEHPEGKEALLYVNKKLKKKEM